MKKVEVGLTSKYSGFIVGLTGRLRGQEILNKSLLNRYL